MTINIPALKRLEKILHHYNEYIPRCNRSGRKNLARDVLGAMGELRARIKGGDDGNH